MCRVENWLKVRVGVGGRKRTEVERRRVFRSIVGRKVRRRRTGSQSGGRGSRELVKKNASSWMHHGKKNMLPLRYRQEGNGAVKDFLRRTGSIQGPLRKIELKKGGR